MNTYRSALAYAIPLLSATSESATLDAEVLLGHVISATRTQLYTWPEREISPQEMLEYQRLVQQRQIGHPIAHLVGKREFWSRDFQVTPDTLIPRPDTELLIEQALTRLEPGMRVLDLGTGSGIIAITLALECPGCVVSAVDCSAPAIDVARENARTLGAEQIVFHTGNWYEPVSTVTFDVVLANPPYIAEMNALLTQGDVRFEPTSALVSGHDGMQDLEQIIAGAGSVLAPAGTLLVEHGFDQGAKSRACLQQHGFGGVATVRDLAGNERVSLGTRQAALPDARNAAIVG